MKVLILTVSAGEGHNSMSRSIAGCIGENAEVMTYDIYKGKSKFYTMLVNKGYFFSCKYFMPISNAFFEKQKRRNPEKREKTVVHKMTKKAKPQVLSVLDEYKPDVVFCAHTYCAHIMSEFKKEGKTDAKVFSVVSDYDVSPFTEIGIHIDYIIAPNEDFDDTLIYKGFKKEQILHLGIPVQTKFSEPLDKVEMRKKLGLDENKFTVMMMNGGVGFGNTIKLIKNLTKANFDFQIISVCGRNEKLKKKIDKLIASNKVGKKIFNNGFVTNVDELMSASDVLIGKIGGVAIAEAFNKGLPIIASHKLPWQEYDNMVYLCEREACDYIAKNKYAYKVLEHLALDEGVYQTRVENIKKIRKQNATRDIVKAMFDSVEK
ncbi:MAG: hypothetical protein IKC83_03380 [Clostridia bacterium]|nr:hypothetical protein [Clostridia bacterium]